jgi:hypothetical protein
MKDYEQKLNRLVAEFARLNAQLWQLEARYFLQQARVLTLESLAIQTQSGSKPTSVQEYQQLVDSTSAMLLKAVAETNPDHAAIVEKILAEWRQTEAQNNPRKN